MFSLCDSHGWASGEWLAINVLINGRDTLERLSLCDAWGTVAAAIVIMDWLGGRSQGDVQKKKSQTHYWLQLRGRMCRSLLTPAV